MSTVVEQVLSDTSKEKVCLIQDINKLVTFLFDDPIIDTESFDNLYDMSIEELEHITGMLVHVAEFKKQARSLTRLMQEIQKHKRKNNEEGD